MTTSATDTADTRRALERAQRRAGRERRAREAAEALFESRVRELCALNRRLAELTARLEERVAERTRESAVERERALALAEHDPLTGLANRARYLRVLGDAVRAARDEGRRAVLMLVDVDAFREVNDTFGHEAGDAFLRLFADRLVAAAGEDGFVARLGGDEFAVLYPERADPAAASAAALHAEICQPLAHNGIVLEVSCSAGVACLTADTDDTATLQRDADIALRAAKAAGRRQCVAIDAAMREAVVLRQRLESELAAAIAEGQIRAWFQPIVDLGSRRCIGAEALARWHHPEFGVLEPAVFIPLMEKQGLADALFRAVLRDACVALRPLAARGALRHLSVNVSPSQFRFGTLGADVLAILEETGFPPQVLVLEITEAVLLLELSHTRDTLVQLCAQGARVALDDFGTGYSNLAYLRSLPVHCVKLDKSLTAGVEDDPRAGRLIRAFVQMAGTLELELVAEGVEAAAQAEWLAAAGCVLQQGYHFERPLPAERLEAVFGRDGT
ncbi:putative bifunctional diguanylate cyclase/phosphodiesterase [Coralloluteibacterium thermophilus]|uniref:Bifunctional diguanylate cyclase/phosphodiesterase n=1 Tax=Coralloluteibacterium thermophilum TaxID=2707049 RepID=A0ABV9NIA0_9GAMM